MEGEFDREIEEILKSLFPTLKKGIIEALTETFKRASYFITFQDFLRYLLSMLEQHVKGASEWQTLWRSLERLYVEAHSEYQPIGIKSLSLADSRAIQYALKLHDFYLGKFFQGDREVRNRVLKWLADRYLERGYPIGRDIKGIEEFRAQFQQYLLDSSEQKARQIIDTSVNYLRNSARIRAMQKAGAKRYRWDATGDRLVCAACRSMDGRVFVVEDAVRVLDTLESSGDPTLIKELRPIITTVQKGTSSSIPTKMPPLHPNCRCRVVMQTEESLPINIETPSYARALLSQRDLEEEFRALSKEEVSNKIKAHLGADWLRPAKGGKGINAYETAKSNLSEHFRRHGKELGYSSPEEYKKAATQIIKSADEVYVERQKGQTFYIFKKGDKIVVSRDDDLWIKTLYRLNKPFEQWVKERQRDGFIKIL
ncbi:minor capsid protein [Thermodesulfovibrio yellowstonii]|uniref:minor capsid protein n=1 Tax=Thermodesulfovibrio yellowstonii TaxID=28262 RepID=UPI0024B344DA|nr:minor capsid protein [Thermodesulfovibrio yellowstonii]MDI6865774.1 minor capsid protein [Thermodesulfovibrio yellowstonii]